MQTLFKLLIILLVLTLLSQLGFPWGNSSTHQDITKAAIENLPYNMATTFRPYKTWLANTSTDNGVRTGWAPNETYFHYINIDKSPPGYTWPFANVPRNLTTYLSQYGGYSAGVDPYALNSITIVLSTAYRNWNQNKTASNFTTCLYWMTRVSHYCADLHQPLHVTWNYDPNGVHDRYESNMLSTYQPALYSAMSTGMIYQSNPLEFAFSIISVAYPYYPKIAQADTTAYNIAHSYNSTYYYSLWTSTQSFTTTLLNLAAKNVASLWYTAWINAGLPVPVELSVFYSTLDTPINKP
ncbi:MAG: hypothetical protein N3A72_05210 [bacterium]|nr:hypothetical protein [bacterium]